MNFLEIARRWTILFLAETLKTTAGAISAVLPFQPRWLAQIALLASELRAAAEGSGNFADVTAAAEIDAEEITANTLNHEALLESHARLRQAFSDICARGLALDPELLQRMRTDWNMESVVSYLSTAEKNLRDAANRALNEAAEPLGMSVAAMIGLSDRAANAVPPAKMGHAASAKPGQKPASSPAHRRASAR
jgi:hypothetical protein